jgi:hypothetical protein
LALSRFTELFFCFTLPTSGTKWERRNRIRPSQKQTFRTEQAKDFSFLSQENTQLQQDVPIHICWQKLPAKRRNFNINTNISSKQKKNTMCCFPRPCPVKPETKQNKINCVKPNVSFSNLWGFQTWFSCSFACKWR